MSNMVYQQQVLPSISVVCPVFNSRMYIKRTLDALFSQELPPSEIIVIDDGSSDGTPEFLRSYVQGLEPNLRFVLLCNKHLGPGAARNAGVLHACSDWIAFLDSDDIWLPNKLARVAQCIQEVPKANFICHHEEFLRSDGARQILAYSRGYRSKLPLPPQLYQKNLFSTSAVTCRRDVLLQYGLFDERLMSAQDYELWLRLSPSISVQFVKEVLGQYVERQGNITSGRVWGRLRNELSIAWRHKDLVTRQEVVRRILIIFVTYGKQCIKKTFLFFNTTVR